MILFTKYKNTLEEKKEIHNKLKNLLDLWETGSENEIEVLKQINASISGMKGGASGNTGGKPGGFNLGNLGDILKTGAAVVGAPNPPKLVVGAGLGAPPKLLGLGLTGLADPNPPNPPGAAGAAGGTLKPVGAAGAPPVPPVAVITVIGAAPNDEVFPDGAIAATGAGPPAPPVPTVYG